MNPPKRSSRTSTSWEQRFDKQFSIGKGRKWILTKEEANEVKDFIKSEKEKSVRETLEKVEKLDEAKGTNLLAIQRGKWRKLLSSLNTEGEDNK